MKAYLMALAAAVLALAVAAAVAVTGTAGATTSFGAALGASYSASSAHHASSARHPYSADHANSAHDAYSAHASGYSAASPASFAGTPINGCGGSIPPARCQGILIFAAGSGRALRTLVDVKDAFAPEVVEHPHAVYYFTDGPGRNCSDIMRIGYSGGRPVLVRRLVNALLGTYAISENGKLLAYHYYPQRQPGPECGETDVSLLTVVNLATGVGHTISGVPTVFDMTWSPGGKDLALEFPSGPYATSTIGVITDPFSAGRNRPGRPLPCPGHVRSCLEFSPRYGGAGQIFYVAGVPPAHPVQQRQNPPCGLTCRYVLTRVTAGHAVALASTSGLNRSQASAWCAVDQAGSAVILTAPSGRGFATYRWSPGRLTRLLPGAAWPSW